MASSDKSSFEVNEDYSNIKLLKVTQYIITYLIFLCIIYL